MAPKRGRPPTLKCYGPWLVDTHPIKSKQSMSLEIVLLTNLFYYLLYAKYSHFYMDSITRLLWYNRFGSWGICFTYGTFFAVKGLALSGRTYENSDAIRKACSFLLSKQLHTGGWGETYLSSETEVSVTSHYTTLWWILLSSSYISIFVNLIYRYMILSCGNV